jgi:hypothetical protein
MNPTIEMLQAELPGDLKDLRVNTAKSILGITAATIRSIKGKLQLKYHPDKNPKIPDRDAINALFRQVFAAPAFYDQEKTMRFHVEVYREYSAQTQSNDRVYTARGIIKYPQSIEIPQPFAEVEDFLRHQYALEVEDIHEVELTIKKYLIDLNL